MDIRYYLGMKQVSRETYETTKEKELGAGHGIVSSEVRDGHPEYTLQDGIVIRGDGAGGFNRIEDGKVMEAWVPGTENEWIQFEQSARGGADFFCRADE